MAADRVSFSYGAAVGLIFAVYLCLLVYLAANQSVTQLEPALIASGFDYWATGSSALYRANPPLVKIVATFPLAFADIDVVTVGQAAGGARPEFPTGQAFVQENGRVFQCILFRSRCLLIPFSLLGPLVLCAWSQELFGKTASLLSLVAYVASPHILSHSAIVGTDIPCCSAIVAAAYLYWRWTNRPSVLGGGAAGVALGVCLLTKFSSLYLLVVWPTLGLLAHRRIRKHSNYRQLTLSIALLLVSCLYVVNAGYLFDDTCSPISSYNFRSALLSRASRLTEFCLGRVTSFIPVPFPRQFLLGIDTQWLDLDTYVFPSFMNGEWRRPGWHLFYLFAASVKLPVGAILSFILAGACWIGVAAKRSGCSVGGFLWLHAVLFFCIASFQVEISQQFRYMFPALPFMSLLCGRLFQLVDGRLSVAGVIASLALVLQVCETTFAFPDELAFVNFARGGAKAGALLLQGSNYDWGQDTRRAERVAADLIERGFTVETLLYGDSLVYRHEDLLVSNAPCSADFVVVSRVLLDSPVYTIRRGSGAASESPVRRLLDGYTEICVNCPPTVALFRRQMSGNLDRDCY